MKRLTEYQEFRGNRTCCVCQEKKGEKDFGKKEYKKASYDCGTRLACAETERRNEYEKSLQGTAKKYNPFDPEKVAYTYPEFLHYYGSDIVAERVWALSVSVA